MSEESQASFAFWDDIPEGDEDGWRDDESATSQEVRDLEQELLRFRE